MKHGLHQHEWIFTVFTTRKVTSKSLASLKSRWDEGVHHVSHLEALDGLVLVMVNCSLFWRIRPATGDWTLKKVGTTYRCGWYTVNIWLIYMVYTYIYIWLFNNLVGGAITILKNDGLRQWEGWHPIYEMEHNPNVWKHQPVYSYLSSKIKEFDFHYVVWINRTDRLSPASAWGLLGHATAAVGAAHNGLVAQGLGTQNLVAD